MNIHPADYFPKSARALADSPRRGYLALETDLVHWLAKSLGSNFMRTLFFAALGACPIVAFVFFAGHCLDEAAHKPPAASMTFTSGSAKEWLENNTGHRIPAVLRRAP